jgi:hypothetical protein
MMGQTIFWRVICIAVAAARPMSIPCVTSGSRRTPRPAAGPDRGAPVEACSWRLSGTRLFLGTLSPQPLLPCLKRAYMMSGEGANAWDVQEGNVWVRGVRLAAIEGGQEVPASLGVAGVAAYPGQLAQRRRRAAHGSARCGRRARGARGFAGRGCCVQPWCLLGFDTQGAGGRLERQAPRVGRTSATPIQGVVNHGQRWRWLPRGAGTGIEETGVTTPPPGAFSNRRGAAPTYPPPWHTDIEGAQKAKLSSKAAAKQRLLPPALMGLLGWQEGGRVRALARQRRRKGCAVLAPHWCCPAQRRARIQPGGGVRAACFCTQWPARACGAPRHATG